MTGGREVAEIIEICNRRQNGSAGAREARWNTAFAFCVHVVVPYIVVVTNAEGFALQQNRHGQPRCG